MRRGEIRLVDFCPTRGAEANKRRPAVIVSNDRANASALRHRYGVITVVPVTSNTTRVFRFQTLLEPAETGLALTSKAQAEQVRSLAIGRVGELLGHVPRAKMAQIDDALRLHLDL